MGSRSVMQPTLKVIPAVSQARHVSLSCHNVGNTPSAKRQQTLTLCRREVPMSEPGRPWWENNAEIAAARDEVERWLQSADPLPPDRPDPVWNDLLSGASTRELVAARRSRSFPRPVHRRGESGSHGGTLVGRDRLRARRLAAPAIPRRGAVASAGSTAQVAQYPFEVVVARGSRAGPNGEPSAARKSPSGTASAKGMTALTISVGNWYGTPSDAATSHPCTT